ncbi:GmrSD restriction endonuclease domain-containing protein, partial [Raoultella ornithinolytica]|uniref:GmrSD restriction endonuclease domain-containing protein n=1 Tax=Raoultella ornithinolytica TaxID=54291 RepID=UPI003F1C093F
RKEQRGAYIVLDGKQRLLSIRQFAAEKNDEVYEPLKLSGLEIRTDLKGKNLHDLKDDATFYNDVAAFENQPIRTVVIKNWPSEEFLYHVFLRLNTGSVQLAPQELRQALHPGAFVSYIDANAPDNEAIKSILKLKKPDF